MFGVSNFREKNVMEQLPKLRGQSSEWSEGKNTKPFPLDYCKEEARHSGAL